MKKYIYIASFIWCASFAFGLLNSQVDISNIPKVSVESKYERLLTFRYIFTNNIKVYSYVSFGFTTLNFSSLISTSKSAYLYGYTLRSLNNAKINYKQIIYSMFPHFIEIAALIIALANSFKISFILIQNLFLSKPVLRKDLQSYIKFFLIGALMIFLGAYIEIKISYELIKLYMLQ